MGNKNKNEKISILKNVNMHKSKYEQDSNNSKILKINAKNAEKVQKNVERQKNINANSGVLFFDSENIKQFQTQKKVHHLKNFQKNADSEQSENQQETRNKNEQINNESKMTVESENKKQTASDDNKTNNKNDDANYQDNEKCNNGENEESGQQNGGGEQEEPAVPFVEKLMDKMQNSKDLVNREILVANKKVGLVFLQDLTSYAVISEYIIKQLIKVESLPKDEKEMVAYLTKDVICGREVLTETDIDKCIFLILKGKVLVAIDGVETKILVDATKFNTRAISEPPTSSVLQGPREGFNESIKNNLSMVRRRISSPNLMIENMEVGRQTQTAVSVMYMKNIADNKIAKEIIDRIKSIDIDGVVDSYYIIEFLQKHKDSIFKQVGTCEKPDIITSKLLEGRIAIFVDGSPIVLTLPFLIFENFQSSEDYYSQHYHGVFVRWLRLIGIALAILLPGIYVSIQLYHYGIIPLKFLVTIANSTDGLPFTPLFEVLFIILLFELLNEASLRMPKYLGMAMSIVGALILGETAVKAGMISPPAVMIIALSSMTIFTVADLSSQLSLLRLGFVLLGGLVGLYGVTLGVVFLIGYMATLDSYGTPFLAPITPKINSDYKDFVNMKSVAKMKERPRSIPNINKTRLKDVENETSND